MGALHSMNDEAAQEPIPVLRACGLSLLLAVLLPFLYLATLALVLSAYVHEYPLPSRAFLKAYAGPSNGLVQLPVVGTVCSNYFQFCVKLTRADHERPHKQPIPPSNAR